MNYNYGYNTPWYYDPTKAANPYTQIPNPYAQNQQMLQQAPLPNQQQSAAQAPIQNELMLIIVKDDNAVQNYPVASGNTVMLMNYETQKFWIKSMTNGISPTITEYEFKAVNENLNPKNQEAVSREEFNNLSDNVSKLQKIIDDLNN